MIWIWIPPVAAGVVYLRMLFADYIWDDAIYQSLQLRYMRTFASAFFPPIGMMEEFNKTYYRPLIPLSSILDNELAKFLGIQVTPGFSHGVNIIYHMGVTYLVYCVVASLLRQIPRRREAALAAATIFAVHPIHAEVVCSVSSRTDLLATLFTLGALLIAVEGGRWSQRWISAIISAFLFFVALLAKETAMAALVLVPAGYWLFPSPAPEDQPRSRPGYFGMLTALLLVAAGAYLYLRFTAGITFGNPSEMHILQKARAIVSAAGYYICKLIVPWPQLHFVVRLPSVFVGLAVTATASIAIGWVWLRVKRGRSVIGYSSLWFTASVALAFVVALRPLSQNPVAERYLYLPSVALSILVGWWVVNLDWKSVGGRIGLIGLLALTMAYAVSTVVRTGAWQSNLAFWTDANRDPAAREHPVVNANLSNLFAASGRLEDARRHLQIAYRGFQAPRDRLRVLVNLASIDVTEAHTRLMEGRFAQAEALAGEAISRLETVLKTELNYAGPPNSTMGAALAIKAQAQKARTGILDRKILLRAIRHLDLALYSSPGDRGLLDYRAECQQLLTQANGL